MCRSSVSIIDRSDTSIIDDSAVYYRYRPTNPFFIETNFRNRITVDERSIVIVDEGKYFYGSTCVCADTNVSLSRYIASTQQECWVCIPAGNYSLAKLKKEESVKKKIDEKKKIILPREKYI